jgi:hypothetical protein
MVILKDPPTGFTCLADRACPSGVIRVAQAQIKGVYARIDNKREHDDQRGQEIHPGRDSLLPHDTGDISTHFFTLPC